MSYSEQANPPDVNAQFPDVWDSLWRSTAFGGLHRQTETGVGNRWGFFVNATIQQANAAVAFADGFGTGRAYATSAVVGNVAGIAMGSTPFMWAINPNVDVQFKVSSDVGVRIFIGFADASLLTAGTDYDALTAIHGGLIFSPERGDTGWVWQFRKSPTASTQTIATGVAVVSADPYRLRFRVSPWPDHRDPTTSPDAAMAPAGFASRVRLSLLSADLSTLAEAEFRKDNDVASASANLFPFGAVIQTRDGAIKTLTLQGMLGACAGGIP